MNKYNIKQIIHPGEKPFSEEDLNKIVNGPIKAGEKEYQKEINKREIIDLDISKIVDIEIEGVDVSDWPDLCDAFISRAFLDLGNKQFRELTDAELKWLETNKKDWYWDYIYKHAMDSFY